MSEIMTDLPQAENADPDGVQMALRAAQTLWSRGDTTESLRWLRRAAETASDEGADLRSFQLAKAAAELRAKLFGSNDAPASARPPAPSEGNVFSAGTEPAELGNGAAALPSYAPPAAGPAYPSVGAWSEDSPSPGSGPVVTATQYPSQYPSHRPRQLMGLSSSTLETAVHREGAAHSAVPSWSADAERRISTAPPPLPRESIDDYEELEAEPDEDAVEERDAPWSVAPPPPSSRFAGVLHEARRDASSDAERRISALPPAAYVGGPLGSSPPPLPVATAGEDAYRLRGEPAVLPGAQLDVAVAAEEVALRLASATPLDASGALASFASPGDGWGSEPKSSAWDAASPFSWDAESRGAWGGASMDSEAQASESAQPKLTARVHHQAVRVSCAPDVRFPGHFLVRPLREGEKALPGERVALLVALEPGQPLV
jgi:hypothetical protein